MAVVKGYHICGSIVGRHARMFLLREHHPDVHIICQSIINFYPMKIISISTCNKTFLDQCVYIC